MPRRTLRYNTAPVTTTTPATYYGYFGGIETTNRHRNSRRTRHRHRILSGSGRRHSRRHSRRHRHRY